MGKFKRFLENETQIKPIPIAQKKKTLTNQVSVKQPKLKSIKITQSSYDQLTLLKGVTGHKYLELLDEAIQVLIADYVQDNPSYQPVLGVIKERYENPDQTSIEDFL